MVKSKSYSHIFYRKYCKTLMQQAVGPANRPMEYSDRNRMWQTRHQSDKNSSIVLATRNHPTGGDFSYHIVDTVSHYRKTTRPGFLFLIWFHQICRSAMHLLQRDFTVSFKKDRMGNMKPVKRHIFLYCHLL